MYVYDDAMARKNSQDFTDSSIEYISYNTCITVSFLLSSYIHFPNNIKFFRNQIWTIYSTAEG